MVIARKEFYLDTESNLWLPFSRSYQLPVTEQVDPKLFIVTEDKLTAGKEYCISSELYSFVTRNLDIPWLE